MVATIGAAQCIANAKAGKTGSRDVSNIMVSQADYDDLKALGALKFETYRAPSLPGHPSATTAYLEGLVVAVMGEPISAISFISPREDKMTATRAAEARDRAREDARGNEPHNAISAVDTIMFGIQLDDHFDRLQWLMDWRDGRWGEMRRNYPEFARNTWRSKL